MKSAEAKRLILASIRADLARFRAVKAGSTLGMSRRQAGEVNYAVRLAGQNTVAYTPIAWIGHVPTEAERQAFSRALVALERDGVIARITDGYEGVRTTHVRLLHSEGAA